MPEPIRVIRELGRILKPQGLLSDAPLGSGIHRGLFISQGYTRTGINASYPKPASIDSNQSMRGRCASSARIDSVPAQHASVCSAHAVAGRADLAPLWLLAVPVWVSRSPWPARSSIGSTATRRFTVGYHVTARARGRVKAFALWASTTTAIRRGLGYEYVNFLPALTPAWLRRDAFRVLRPHTLPQLCRHESKAAGATERIEPDLVFCVLCGLRDLDRDAGSVRRLSRALVLVGAQMIPGNTSNTPLHRAACRLLRDHLSEALEGAQRRLNVALTQWAASDAALAPPLPARGVVTG
jgi:hypothetical protein